MKMLRQQASAWMPMLEADPEVWSKQLVRHGIEESLFAEDPVFAFVSAEHAAEMLHRVPAPTLEIVRRSLKERYAHPNESTKWKLDELPFLQKVYEHLTARVKSNGGPMSLSKYALETWFLPGLEMITNDLLTFQSQLAPKSQAGQ